ncbi:MAG: MBL fold metallo-hydrolase [Thermogemmatispora sp.]|jgi:glyoxylase-like metal-dependent hydrolase (beta-lactamase superfamily II)|uniref:MBL fold hydrolase n=1 Tax=Thermogemmatispora aurantia TaxID=2045279 RepID=A0A5J4KHA1_9CHLR|nr:MULTISPECIES: MBL fold metallo-hydrolase [Thermogemmatispora]MBE3567619.1 MBL fold metallo-hydrolase [Thermogemmatispora sp.]GER85126.1 MBL fold hydrolase [Thermogemmatispora aurantia]
MEQEQKPQEEAQPYTLVLAPNPSVMTGPGTNTIVVGEETTGALVIDPAVDDPAYLEQVIAAGEARGGIRRILITHGHPDHCGGAAALRTRLGVPVLAFSRAGMALADEELEDGARLAAGDDTLRAIYTPGHRFDHLCFLLERAGILFAGDLLAGVGTVVIAPPEGDMGAYLTSLRRLQSLELRHIVPAHGPIILDPARKLAEYIEHRLLREQQVITALGQFPQGATVGDLVPYVYADVSPSLHTLAAQSLTAHLLKLEQEGRVHRHDRERWLLRR